MPLQSDYRPKTLADIVGNDNLKESLTNLINRPKRPHVYLLVGPYGTGKTTIALIIKDMLGCQDIDFYHYNSANFRGIDTAREIIKNAPAIPYGDIKVFFLEEFHGQLMATQEALLDILEFYPPHCYFILATTNPEKINQGIITRSSMFTTSLLSSHQMRSLINKILKSENKEVPSTLIDEIINAAEGSSREALKLLEQVIDIRDSKEAMSLIRKILASDDDIRNLCRELYKKGDPNTKWEAVKKQIEIIGENDPEKIRRKILSYFDKALINSKSSEDAKKALKLIGYFEANYFSSGKAGLHSSCCMAALDL